MVKKTLASANAFIRRGASSALLRAATVSLLFFCICLSLAGCTRDTEGVVGIAEGGLAWSRKDWSAAVSSFLKTAEKAKRDGNARLYDYAVYGLATSYLSQDEFDSAIARLSGIGPEADKDIRSGMWYQAGIIAYRRGEYGDAVSCFRKSLESDPSAIDAKINLELSLRVIAESRNSQSKAAAGVSESSGTNQEAESIFNLIRKKEQDVWKNQEDTDSRVKTADY
jgi:Ca-activated chloride channel family protein